MAGEGLVGAPGAVRIYPQVDRRAEHAAQQGERPQIGVEVVADLHLHLAEAQRAHQHGDGREPARRREGDHRIVVDDARLSRGEPAARRTAKGVAGGIQYG